jgi:hypothetical protein
MNKPHQPSAGMNSAQAIMGGGLQNNGPKMRYQFIPNEQHKGFVLVFDMTLQQVTAELCDEHAKMIYLMYANLHARHPLAGDEFMYGHIMGITLTMLHADKYPKITLERGPDGAKIKVTATTGEVTISDPRAPDPENAQNVKEMGKRIRGSLDDDEGGEKVPV